MSNTSFMINDRADKHEKQKTNRQRQTQRNINKIGRKFFIRFQYTQTFLTDFCLYSS